MSKPKPDRSSKGRKISKATKQNSYRILGRVIDGTTRQGVVGLKVEAWDKELVFDDLVASAMTGAEGRFEMQFTEAFFNKIFFHRSPDLFFKVFAADTLLRSTRDSVLWNVKAGNTPVEIAIASPSPSRSFTVSGAVRLPDGSQKKRQRLLAFDLDLPGVAVYRQVKTMAEIGKRGGFEFLGLTTSDNRGNYSLTFYDWQYQRAERLEADVVVYAVEGEKEDGRIIGRSRLVNSEDYSDQGLVRELDVTVTETDPRAEYEVLMNALSAFLKESDTSLGKIATSPEQLAFAAGELDLEPGRVNIAARAELLNQSNEQQLSHELLYGLGRQDVQLDWATLFRKQEDELRVAITKSAGENIIREFSKSAVTVFLRALQESAAKQLLDDKKPGGGNTVNAMLSNALPKEAQRLSFLNAFATFTGSDFREFWSEHLPAQPEFKDKPQLVADLLLTQQLALLTGHHQALVNELQVNKKVASTHQLFDLEKDDWVKIIKKTGVPDFVEGNNEEERISGYAGLLQSLLNAAFPTQRIRKMVEKDQLPIERKEISESIAAFLSKTPHFDFATSRVHDLEKEIKAAAGQNFDEVRGELMKIQRVFQVSTTPEAMAALMEENLSSSYTVANIPRKSFIKTYGDALGGERAAFAIHQRASHIAARTEKVAMHMMEYSHGIVPEYAMGPSDSATVMTVLEGHVPNYAALFGSPDLCECGHCRSVYSAAAYFVDLLRFLWRGTPNDDDATPLDMLASRRPDLLHLPLTCENTNTIIPYIDLANEVMEYYAAHDSLGGFKGYDTGNSTVQELRANPQNVNLAAYRKLKDAKYPFTLPYHQPLDVIRIYSDHLKVSRYEAMKAMNPLPSNTTARALAAESLCLSEEEYQILTGFDFAGNSDSTPLHEHFGYNDAGELENMSAVREFLHRSGVAYTELVDLVKTQFINPFQGTVDFLQKIASFTSIAPDIIYAELKAGTFNPTTDSRVLAALIASGITPPAPALWTTNSFSNFQQVLTLFEPDSKCDLDTTSLRTIQSIYENSSGSGLTGDNWSNIHRFIRLWRKLGWTIHDTDVILAAIGESDITPDAILELESVSLLRAATKLPLNELAVFWGKIDTYGDKSLYQKLFLNKAQQIDAAFKSDVWGNYLQDNLQTLFPHQSAILAAFRIREEDLAAILNVARVFGLQGPRPINIATDVLNVANLSAIYRYVLLAKALKMGIADLCKLIALFGVTPFSTWHIQQQRFIDITPSKTYAFYKLASSTKEAGFKPSVLEYIMQGTHAADSQIGLARGKSLQAARNIRGAFAVIEQNHPEAAPSPLTPDMITAKLALTFQPEIVSRFLGILDGTASFETLADDKPDVTIPGYQLFSLDNLTDVPGLVGQFRAHIDAVSDYLWNRFSAATQQVLNNVNLDASQYKRVLVDELNRVLLGGSIYHAHRFASVALSADTVALQAQNPQGADLIRFNRLLLEDAYPAEIAKAPISEALSKKYTYGKSSGRLTCTGVMSDTEKSALKSLAHATADFVNAVDKLYEAPEDFIGANFNGIFSDLAEANATLLDHPAQDPAATLEERLSHVYDHFMPVLKGKLRRDVVTQHVAALIGLTEEAMSLLIADDIADLIQGLSTTGYSADYSSDSQSPSFSLSRTDNVIDFSWGPNARDGLAPGVDNLGVSWAAYIAAPASGDYTLIVDVEGADPGFSLYLDGKQILEKNSAVTSWQVPVSLNAAQLYSLRLAYAEATENAGVRLQWKTPTTALEVVPASVAYPAAILDKFVAEATIYHRAAKFILGFKLTETEINHFITYPTDFDNIDFKALTVDHWRRIYDYTVLRNAVPQGQALLTDVFAAAKRANPVPTKAELRNLLYQATAWDKTNLTFTAGLFAPGVADFKNEIALNRLREVMQIVARTGLSAKAINRWGAAETDFDALNNTAQLLKNTARAKYEEKDWLDLAGELNDTIREDQKQALIAYLLTQTAIQNWGAKDADGLFEYLLIDVQMGACMDTSRIVAANSAVQMFVSRCLLNLESEVSSDGVEKGISPGAITRDRWEWMKNYRVWEANRKVFLYPENWLEPDWRMDRSEFFKELESYLVQNDITDRSVEQAFRDYLTNLNEVANLEVCGMHKETYKDGVTFKYLHVFARTHNAPYKFFYRRWNKAQKWSAWEKVPVDIRCVENGDNSGVHLIPVMWKNRLFLFWPEFTKVQKAPRQTTTTSDGSQTITTIEGASKKTVSQLEAIPSWEIRLAWSEYVDGKWNPKQVSKEFIERALEPNNRAESRIRWIYDIGSKQRLEIGLHVLADRYWVEKGWFYLSDITSKVETFSSSDSDIITRSEWTGYELSFMNYSKEGKLDPAGDDYLTSTVNHKVLVTPTRQDYVPRLKDPFFFSDIERTYFVRPVEHTVIDWIQNAARYKPSFLALAADNQSQSASAIPDGQLTNAAMAMRESGGTAGRSGNLPSTRTGSTERQSTAPAVGQSASAANSMAGAGSLSQNFGGVAYAEGAFGGSFGTLDLQISGIPIWSTERGLEFHTFYHPFISGYVQNLNQDGLPGLMRSDTDIASDGGATFENVYKPNFTNGLVQRPSDFMTRTYYKENVCFDVYGANSIYNWELFFHAPLYIAIRLSKNGKFEEAMKWFHYIFDPTTDDMPDQGESEVSRYWKVLPFKTTLAQDLEDWFRQNLSSNTDSHAENATIAEWRDNPFDPHLIASNRPLAYMKHVVIKYVENLIAWGDSLFRQDTMESVNEALQIYVIANHILGPRPELVPKRGEIKAATYDSLKSKWDDFSNALVELENLFPFSSQAPVSPTSTGANVLGIGSALYFCIPPNEKLLEYWDTAADRLFKIRHCQNIDGVERHLALFSPPIDPAALIQAASQGLSLGSILADLSSPPPIYRFSFLIQKANEFCSDVKALGSALLSALEKKDAEELGRLRASQETQMLELMTAIKERQVLDAKAGKESLEKGRETAAFRLQHYIDLLGNESVTVPAEPTISVTLTADSQLPADTSIATIVTDVDESLVDSDETGVKLIPKETEDIDKSLKAIWWQGGASASEALAGILHLLPNASADAKPFGIGAGMTWGGSNWGAATSSLAKVASIVGSAYSYQATQAAKMASYIRREQDWTLQANLAAREIVQLDKQITSADIRVQVTQKELENHKQQIENAKATETFLKNKFTNQELYQWMKEQLFAVYKQGYNLAYDMAKKAEKAYKFEMGTDLASFIQYGYWDNSMQGLVAGDKLQLALRQLEKSYLEENRREFELTKNISLVLLDPLALVQLRETGRCFFQLPEEIFDLDYPGHYFRRIKSVSLTLPCVVGPYTNISCTLRQLKNSIRVNTGNGDNGYPHNTDDNGVPADDVRFVENNIPVKAVAASHAQNDSGVFELNFRDDRYLPFEGAGVISGWSLELFSDLPSNNPDPANPDFGKPLRQFDYNTISDAILHVKYTAREDAGPFKNGAVAHLRDYFSQDEATPSLRSLNLRHDFPTQWHRFLNPTNPGGENVFEFEMSPALFPFRDAERTLKVNTIWLLARCTDPGNYAVVLSPPLPPPPTLPTPDPNKMTLSRSNQFGGLHFQQRDTSALTIEIPPTGPPAKWQLKMTRPGGANLEEDPVKKITEVQDVILVLGYEWD